MAGVAGGTDDPVREFVGEGEAFALDVGPARYEDGVGDRLTLPQDLAGQPVDALGEIVFYHLNPLLLEEGAQAGHRIQAEVPRVAKFIGPVVDLFDIGNAVVPAAFKSVARGRNAEDLFDGQISLEVVDQHGFGLGAIPDGGAGVLTELDAVEDLDLGTHEEVQRDVESLPETDQDGRRWHHLPRLVLADGLSGDLRIHLLGQRPQGKASAFAGEP